VLGTSRIDGFRDILTTPAHHLSHRKDGSLYLESWFLLTDLDFGNDLKFMLHRFNGNDTSGMIHEHACKSISVCLEGSLVEEYLDHGKKKKRVIKEGDILYRDEHFVHTLHGYATTLYITGINLKDIIWYPGSDLKKENGVAVTEVFDNAGNFK
jgi:hypothetical protein